MPLEGSESYQARKLLHSSLLVIEQSPEWGYVDATDSSMRLQVKAIEYGKESSLGLPTCGRGKDERILAFTHGCYREFLNRA